MYDCVDSIYTICRTVRMFQLFLMRTCFDFFVTKSTALLTVWAMAEVREERGRGASRDGARREVCVRLRAGRAQRI